MAAHQQAALLFYDLELIKRVLLTSRGRLAVCVFISISQQNDFDF